MVDHTRIASLRPREEERFAADHPRSAELAERARGEAAALAVVSLHQGMWPELRFPRRAHRGKRVPAFIPW
ncbi:hypothetical protein [Nocardioides sp. YIM 152315]|uniref:hypothetical protein n=1 Tax=Nocardioides sp. YIM 152315 TaxID=3031760 RepID=UPI0023DC5262|nr:hypothetical protein [Nocardioides sp. YIM 152315]MDF1604813.1 hypothetical protein [Nocardioides sp. YIM 152315]